MVLIDQITHSSMERVIVFVVVGWLVLLAFDLIEDLHR
jgi:hypothetical protein